MSVEVEGIEVLNVHSPISPSPGLAKVLTHEALYAYASERDRIVIAGDLNTPRRTHVDGTVLTFAHDTKGRLREERGERWAAAERALVYTLRAEHRFQDAFLDAPERTWTFKDDRGGWRLDHLLTKGVIVHQRAYVHDWRRSGLSDHSAIAAEILRGEVASRADFRLVRPALSRIFAVRVTGTRTRAPGDRRRCA